MPLLRPKILANSQREVMKVQLSIASTAPVQQMVVYNANHSLFFVGDATPPVRKVMEGRNKAYFWGKVTNGILELEEPAVEQNW